MKLDRGAVERLLALNDRQLEAVIRRLAEDNGIDLSAVGIHSDNIAAVRQALRMATDADLVKAAEQISKLRRTEGAEQSEI